MGIIIKILFLLLTLGSFRALIFLFRKGNPKSDKVLMARLKIESQSPRQNLEKEMLSHLKNRFRAGGTVMIISFTLSLIAGMVCLLSAWEGTLFFFTLTIINLFVLMGLIPIYYWTKRTI